MKKAAVQFEQPLSRSSLARLPFPSGKTQGLQKERRKGSEQLPPRFQSNLFIVFSC
jgi:hypothetical protein